MPKNTIALDLGATKTIIGVVDKKNRVIFSHKISTPNKKGRAYFFQELNRLIAPLKDKNTRAIALGVAGQVDLKKQIIHLYPNFPRAFQNVKLAQFLKNKFKLPVAIDNDVHCFTLAEALLGAGKKYRYVMGLTLGTGIGGGLVINKKLFRGYNNLVGEFGHQTIDAIDVCRPPRLNTNHDFGRWEALASGTGLTNLYRQLTGQKKESVLIKKLAESGDKKARRAAQKVTDYLAIGLANLINGLNPEVVVIGGGLVDFPMIWSPLLKQVRAHLIQPEMQKTKIVKSQLGDDAILIGAALLAKNTDRFKL